MKTVEDAAQRLGVSVRRIRHFIEDGRLPAKKLAGAWFIEEDDLEAFAGAGFSHTGKPGRPGRPGVGSEEGEE